MTKSEIRKSVLQQRAHISRDERKSTGIIIQNKILQLESFATAKTVCVYLALNSELATDLVIDTCYTTGRKVCVPAWDSADKKYKLYELWQGIKLFKSRMGIMEPEEKKELPIDTVDMFVLPGLAYDVRGARIGYGGGHYDRMLANARPDCHKIAICFDWQIQTFNLPLVESDILVDRIVTEKQIVACRLHRN